MEFELEASQVTLIEALLKTHTYILCMHENLLCNTIYRLKTLRSENEKFESVFCVCFCSLLSSCYLCKAMMNDEPYLEPLIKLNKTSLVSAHVDIFLKSV